MTMENSLICTEKPGCRGRGVKPRRVTDRDGGTLTRTLCGSHAAQFTRAGCTVESVTRVHHIADAAGRSVDRWNVVRVGGSFELLERRGTRTVTRGNYATEIGAQRAISKVEAGNLRPDRYTSVEAFDERPAATWLTRSQPGSPPPPPGRGARLTAQLSRVVMRAMERNR